MIIQKLKNLKCLHSFFFAPKQAFTLVELIVVISVLGVLATIAFTQVSNVTLSARNSTRMTNLQSISSALNMYAANNGVYPIPDNKTDILYSGSIIGYQWYIKDAAARLLKLSPTASQDPLNTSTYFSYATNQSRTYVQLLWFLELNNTTSLNILPITIASDELSSKTPYSKGEELGMLYVSGTTTPLSGTSLELSVLTNSYTAYYNSIDSLTGTGKLLQNLVISYAHGSGFGSPATDDCPTGFIPVPGNKDFNQPGFCVAKYEMKQEVGDATVSGYSGGWYVKDPGSQSYCSASSVCASTGSRNFTNPIISKAAGNPIASINQYNAIEACKAMGAGYHLITNNEWMTIARDIEWAKNNWMSGVVGSGSLYKWSSDYLPAYDIPASPDDNDGYFLTGDDATSVGDGAFTGYTADTEQTRKGQKRTFVLSNGQIIWDFAGNALEHVNKANTIDGSGYTSVDTLVSDVCGGSAYYSFYGNDGQPECPYINGYSYSAWWPVTPNLNTNNGIGRVSSYIFATGASVSLARGWNWWQGASGGLYMFGLAFLSNTTSPAMSFRCAK